MRSHLSLPSRLPAGVSRVDLGGNIVAPGYLDLHIHGSAGYDVMDDSPEALPAIERLLPRHGVTSYLPTTVTAPIDITLRALERLAIAIEAHEAARKKAQEDGREAMAASSSVKIPCSPVARSLSAFTWKDHSSAMPAAAFTRHRTCFLRNSTLSSASGRLLAAAFAC